MRKAAILLLLSLMGVQQALAADDGAAKKGDGTLKKAGDAAGRGIEKGADAAGRGIKKGGEAAGKGIEKAGTWVQKKLGKGGGKKEGSD